MFLKLMQLLNLVAFTAHAVLGCCGHHWHEHGISLHGDAFHKQHVLASSVCDPETNHTRGSSQHCQTHDGSHLVSHAEAAETTGKCFAPIEIDAWTCHTDAIPCGHQHDCDGDSCRFTSNATGSAGLSNLVPQSVLRVAHGKELLSKDFRFGILQADSRQQQGSVEPALLCAQHQSWQI